MPDHRLESLGVRRQRVAGHGRDDHADVGDLRGESTGPADDTEDAGTHTFGVLERADEVDADAALRVAPTNREDPDDVTGTETASSKPVGEGRVPSVVV